MTSVSTPQANGTPAPPADPSTTTVVAPTDPNAPTGTSEASTTSKSTAAPRPRDSRIIELLLTSQGVTSYESRVPLVLMDFAYRHTSAVLSDAIHLSTDPITTGRQATAPASGVEPVVTPRAVKLAIAARLGFQFRGGGAGGGLSKEWLQELAKERNKVALPKVSQNDWAVRLPSERFVLSGLGWGLKDKWEEEGMESSEEEEEEAGGGDEEMEDAMEGVEKEEDVGGDGVEGGTMEDVFGRGVDEDEYMENA